MASVVVYTTSWTIRVVYLDTPWLAVVYLDTPQLESLVQASCTTMASRGLQITATIIVQASYTMASRGTNYSYNHSTSQLHYGFSWFIDLYT